MASSEDEFKDLKAKNSELVQKVQYWKMLAGQRENENLKLMKEINELRLKLSRLRSNGNVLATNFDAALQSASEKALNHLVRASSEIASSMELAKAYMRSRQELDVTPPRWNSIGGTPNSDKKDKINRVPPLMMGGQSIQPVVSLSRTMLDISSIGPAQRSPNQNRNVTERVPLPMHMLQDVYIPLTRIDAPTLNMENEPDSADNSSEDLGLDDSERRSLERPDNMSNDGDYSSRLSLPVVSEELEPEEDEATPPRTRTDNPLEGPSWMLDSTGDQTNASLGRSNLEPDSTTEPDESIRNVTPTVTVNKHVLETTRISTREFSPTVRRRKRTSSPAPPLTPRRQSHFTPRTADTSRTSNEGRVLKVMVTKMSLDQTGRMEGGGGSGSPPKRLAVSPQFDAPSPNGATVAGVIVSESSEPLDELALGEPSPLARRSSQHERNHLYEQKWREGRNSAGRAPDTQDASRRTESGPSTNRTARQQEKRSVSRVEVESRRTSRRGSNDSRDSDSSSGEVPEGRTRRARKLVQYKEKPLNRKMRR